MSKSALLLGARHDLHGLAPCWHPHVLQMFLDRCAEIIRDAQLAAAAEEACMESINRFSRHAFNGMCALGQWCASQGLCYLAFDVTDEECARLDIPQSDSMQRAEMNGEAALAERLGRERFRKREAEWIRRLSMLEVPSVLIVVGTSHVDSMQAGLQAIGWHVEIAEPNWVPPGEAGIVVK